MAYSKTKLMAGLSILPKDDSANESANHLADLMADPAYLRHSSAIINEALQKGFDVLQLANGDIVTTGTKTIVHTYSWDARAGKLARLKAAGAKGKRASKDDADDDLD